MSKFQEGKIYKLVSDKTDRIYIGSTTDPLIRRIKEHRTMFRFYMRHNEGYYSGLELFKEGNVSIELIEKHPCNSREELFAREDFYIQLNRDKLINKNRAYLTVEERKKQEKIYKANYKRNNPKSVIESCKRYYNKNKQELGQINKRYYNDHIDKVKAWKKEYYKANKEIIKEIAHQPFNCECGITVCKGTISVHKKTHKHINQIYIRSIFRFTIYRSDQRSS